MRFPHFSKSRVTLLVHYEIRLNYKSIYIYNLSLMFLRSITALQSLFSRTVIFYAKVLFEYNDIFWTTVNDYNQASAIFFLIYMLNFFVH